MNHTSWVVTGYYSQNVSLPKRPGELALQVVCRSESVRDLEVEVFEDREDIDDVKVTVLSGWPW